MPIWVLAGTVAGLVVKLTTGTSDHLTGMEYVHASCGRRYEGDHIVEMAPAIVAEGTRKRELLHRLAQ